jgi:NAD-dependent dihydropyrimidine dehydrogenase PreA subunit
MSYRHIYFDKTLCTGCNVCIDICPCDVLAPNPEKGEPPIVKYPEECYIDGACVTHCPQKAIEIVTPFPMRGAFQKIK